MNRKDRRKGLQPRATTRGKHPEPEIDLMVELSMDIASECGGWISVLQELRGMLERAYSLGKGEVESIYKK